MSESSRLPEILKVLAEPNRLRIARHLGDECRPVSDVIRATGLPQTNVSFHLRVLREAGLVTANRRGPFVYYCLRDAHLLKLLSDIEAWLAQLDGDGSTAGDTRAAASHGASDRTTKQEATP